MNESDLIKLIDEEDFDSLVQFYSMFESAEELESWYYKIDEKQRSFMESHQSENYQ
jgi:hypothetical protein